jgi:DNA-binding winged helix-turn-helix (wHTH) protein/Tfp pilus assembly protein PilF
MKTAERYAFGSYVLEIDERRLTEHGRPVSLPPKAYDVLVALVRRPGQLVTKRELLDAVWPDAFVEEGILTVHMSALRKALNDLVQPPRVIETVRRSGYRFIASVSNAGSHPPRGRSGALLIGLSDALTDRLQARVFELCGTGKAHLQSASLFEVPKAVESFTAAIELDPAYAPAHAGLALAHCARASMRLSPPREAYDAAKAAALRALALDDESADAQVALGTVLFFSEWDFDGAERSLRRALAINPSHQQGSLNYGRLLDACGRSREALAVKLRTLENDPKSPLVHVQLALTYWNQRKYDEAIEWAEKALAIDNRHLLAREFLVGAYMQKREHDRGMTEAIRHAESFGVSPDALQPLKDAYAAGGRPAVVRYSVAHLRETGGAALQLALLCAEAGDLDSAFSYLDRAIDARDPSLVDLAVAPQWDPMRADPRFARSLTRVGLR